MIERNDIQPSVLQIEPVLAVRDIVETVSYWHEVLGFPEKWTWGTPPTHGSVSWHGTSVQFTLNSELASVSAGHSVFTRVRYVEHLYKLHQQKRAEIVAPLENKPWGLAQYTVRDINGYYVHFAGAPVSERERSAPGLPEVVRIVNRIPTPNEYRHLASAVYHIANADKEKAALLLAPVVTAAVAENKDTGEVIGCALLLGDHVSFYYVKDVMVHPAWQHQQVGAGLMKELTRWLEANAPDNALVTLITPDSLAPFYKQFGFTPAFGMVREIIRSEKR
ncbi:GNAT family N-acetyltransferase [Fulvivirgaceae bacterium PWU4]|uniref:GNAT family N-acetyltransferase n=1 Tax=Chryseosolibacter histidini TaxID=2782349 RepID=A0AAP2DL82_9BACT|nr:GNAT family N-acetyltransferase [Chryseosolibacter histidini]MBT1697002.1 GNAT family N-acetyltransferase [Chryseosolibacter histidini]